MSAQIDIPNLPTAAALTGTELVPVVQNGVTVHTTAGAIAVQPTQTQTFLTQTQEVSLANSRYLSSGTGISLVDGGAGSFFRVSLNGTALSLQNASTGIVVKDTAATVASRSIAASGAGLSVSDGDGVAGNPTVALSGLPATLANLTGAGFLVLRAGGTSINPRTILGAIGQIAVTNGDGQSSDPTIGLATTAVTPGVYGANSKTLVQTVDAYGRLTANSEVAIAISNGQVSGLGSMSTQSAGAVAITGGTITGITDLAIADGGTGASTAATARANLLPSYATHAGEVLTVNSGATDTEWKAIAGTGTVTSVAALTLGTTGTDLSSTVANGSTTPVITLQVPTASATNRGALSAADWSTFNGKQDAFGNQLANVVYAGPTGASGPPSFRALIAADIPSLSASYIPYSGATADVDLNAKHLVNIAHLGVGTTVAPNILARFVGDNGSLSRVAMRGYSSDANGSAIRVAKFRGTYLAPQVPQSGDSLGRFEFTGYATTSADGLAGAYWEGITTEMWGATAHGTKALLYVTPNTSIVPVVAITVDQDKGVTFAGAVNATLFTGNVSGTAANVTGTVAVANGGTGQTTALAGFNALSPMTTAGDMVYGGVAGSATRLGVGAENTVIHGGSLGPIYSAVVEADISLSANTTNDVSIAKHGFCPVLPNNANQFLNGQGNYTIPSGLTISASYSATSFSGQTSVTVIHNFGTYPLVQVIDNTGAMLIPLAVINNTINDFTVTFNASTTGTIMASVGSPQPQSVTVVAASTYAVLTSDRIVKVTASGCVVTLPTSVGNTGREFNIVNASTGTISVVGTSSQTINVQRTQTLPSYSAMTVFADGANYWII